MLHYFFKEIIFHKYTVKFDFFFLILEITFEKWERDEKQMQ